VAEKSGFNIFYPKPIFQSKIPRKHFTSRDKHIHGLKKNQKHHPKNQNQRKTKNQTKLRFVVSRTFKVKKKKDT